MNERRPFLFRTVVWLTWMLAALGVLLYARHIWWLGQHLGQGSPSASSLWPMLAWDVLYLLAAGLTLAAATGVLMWRAWARPLLRWIAFALAAYALARGITLFAHWQSFRHDSAVLAAQARDADMLHAMVAQTTRRVIITLALRGVLAALLAWLGWQLGAARVQAHFSRTR
jgi:hypothetical protein